MGEKRKKGTVSSDTIIYWIIGLFVLVLIGVLFFILKDKGLGIFEHIKNLFKYGR